MQNNKDRKIEEFQNKILEWFRLEGRHYPWRNPSANNYQKIISEVLLQRTRAETIAKFFPEFIKKYPSWRKLGLASEIELQEVLRPIGLYKQRGSRMYKLAQEMSKRNGHFPKSRADVEDIPMMGQYITNAYELFILKKPSPLLDVNMARVLERYFGPRQLEDIRYDPYLQNLSNRVVDNPEIKQINWAILDFGALICKKRNPLCSECPLYKSCSFFEKYK
jgi:A/G-specific adenine glycosylase